MSGLGYGTTTVPVGQNVIYSSGASSGLAGLGYGTSSGTGLQNLGYNYGAGGRGAGGANTGGKIDIPGPNVYNITSGGYTTGGYTTGVTGGSGVRPVYWNWCLYHHYFHLSSISLSYHCHIFYQPDHMNYFKIDHIGFYYSIM